MYLPRTLSDFARQAAESFPSLLVTGARQVGKTTLLRELCEPGRAYVTLDDPLVLELAREDPALFLQRFPPPVLIDEVQYAPQLFPHIKRAVDQVRRPGQFWLTGSQSFHLMRNVAESLAGRVAIVRLLGLSQREAQGRGAEPVGSFLPTPSQLATRAAGATALDLRALYRTIWRGAFPAIVADARLDRDLYYGSYLQTYLQRDLRDLARVGDELAFQRFLRGTAARTGQLLNVADLARDVDVAPNTARAWLSILETSGLIYLLPPWHSNLGKRLLKTPKLYFLDTGLCAYLTQWSTPETLEAGAMSGAILETWAIAEMLKSYWHQGRMAPFHYYRDKDQREIDLMIEADGVLHPIEIKKTAVPGRDALRGIAALAGLGAPVGPGAVLCLAPEPTPLSESVTAVPFGWL
jgi:hypothetical protein